jgi:hypothetical protein
VELAHPDFSIRRQCELLGVNRAGLYYQPRGESEENLRLMRLLDEQYTRTPFYGRRRMRAWLQDQGYEVNSKRVARLMELIGIAAIYPKPKLSVPGEGHKIYPYLLEGVEVKSREPGMEHGHYVHSNGVRVRVSGGGDGLAQPVRTELGIVSDDGSAVLHRGLGTGAPLGPAGDFQQRPRVAVHQ